MEYEPVKRTGGAPQEIKDELTNDAFMTAAMV
jgi:hypothetical protein